MTAMTPAMDAALAAANVILFGAIEIQGIPGGGTLRLVDGASEVSWSVGTFTGRHDVFGTLSAIDMPEDGMGDQAPGMSLTLLPPSTTAAVALSSPTMQGGRVRLWLGAVNPSTGAVVADPYCLFDGEIDQPHLTVDGAGRSLELDCTSAFERMFESEEGQRLSRSFHQSVWPGETGLDNVTGVIRAIVWGPGDRPAAINSGGGATGGYSGGGAGGSFGGSSSGGGLFDFDRSVM